MHTLLHSENLKTLYHLGDIYVGSNVISQCMFKIGVGGCTLDYLGRETFHWISDVNKIGQRISLTDVWIYEVIQELYSEQVVTWSILTLICY